jgi:hypothetical protein
MRDILQRNENPGRERRQPHDGETESERFLFQDDLGFALNGVIWTSVITPANPVK